MEYIKYKNYADFLVSSKRLILNSKAKFRSNGVKASHFLIPL
jgi:hypothetical protein